MISTPYIFFIIHGTGCLVLSIVLLSDKISGVSAASNYRYFLRMLAILMFVQFPADCLWYWSYEHAYFPIVRQLIYPSYIFLQVCFYSSMCHLLLHTPAEQRRGAHLLRLMFLLLVLFYPVLVATMHSDSTRPFTLQVFLDCSVGSFVAYYGQVLRLVAIILIIFGLVLLMKDYRVYKKAVVEQKCFGIYFPFLLTLFIFVISLVSFVISSFELEFYGWNMLLWLVFSIWLCMFALNHKDELLRVEQAAAHAQIEVELERTRKRFSASAEQRELREREVVMRALQIWSQRPDKPYMREGITLMDVAEEMVLPPAALYQYGIRPHGLNFEEYILYLRAGSAEAISKSMGKK